MSRIMNALVIGNAEYEDGDVLKNPVNDAKDMAAALMHCGFKVIEKADCHREAMDRALKRFQRTLKGTDVALFFFAGHGVQVQGENYLAAVDTDASDEISLKHSSLSLNRVIEVMENSGCATSIIILDACRRNPFRRAWTRAIAALGLAPVYAPRGTLIAFATSPGQNASDGAGRNGAYTAALLQHLATPDCSIENMFKRVRNSLSASTRGKQISWEHTSLASEFFFNLSLGVRIDLYDQTALSDSLFVLDDAKASHRMIRELKSSTWPRQNPAVLELTSATANRASVDSLFVLGRNLYQAACGDANASVAYISDFATRSTGMKEEKHKALLDGMLFEAFYDSDGQLRKSFKLRKFGPLFALQRHKRFHSSFDFIAECLLPDAASFYAIPGKRHEVVVDVVTTPAALDGHHILSALHHGGENILWLEDEDYFTEPGDPPKRERLSIANFEARLAEQMVVAPHLLRINYLSFAPEEAKSVHFPFGWTVGRQ
jgi:hypothetical protein